MKKGFKTLLFRMHVIDEKKIFFCPYAIVNLHRLTLAACSRIVFVIILEIFRKNKLKKQSTEIQNYFFEIC